MTTNHFRLSRDGRRLATYINDEQNPDVWVLDVATGDRDRLTFAEAWDWTPVWSRDDRQIAYSFSRTDGASIGIKEVETSADVRRIDTDGSGIWLTDWSRDGRWLAFDRTSPGNRRDVVVMPLESTGDSALVIATAADECCARFSPDGRWMAYEADGEVYVTAFASLDTKRQISTGGGLKPIWSSDGDELFFWRDSTVMSARVISGNRFAYETPRPLFTVSEATGMTVNRPDYDVAPGGDRFLISVANPAVAAREIHVVVNWLERLKGENE